MAEPESTEPDVDDKGEPETPAKVAVEKQRKKQLTYAGLALGALGVVVAVVTLKGRSSASGATTTPVSSFSTLPDGTVAGGGSAGAPASDSSLAAIGALQAQMAADEQASSAANAGFSSTLARLTSELHATGGANSGDQARILSKVNASDYAQVLPAGVGIDVIGTETKGGYKGSNLRLGAPLYAWINGAWRQGINPAKAPVGTTFGTTNQFAPYVVPPPQPTAVAAKK